MENKKLADKKDTTIKNPSFEKVIQLFKQKCAEASLVFDPSNQYNITSINELLHESRQNKSDKRVESKIETLEERLKQAKKVAKSYEGLNINMDMFELVYDLAQLFKFFNLLQNKGLQFHHFELYSTLVSAMDVEKLQVREKEHSMYKSALIVEPILRIIHDNIDQVNELKMIYQDFMDQQNYIKAVKGVQDIQNNNVLNNLISFKLEIQEIITNLPEIASNSQNYQLISKPFNVILQAINNTIRMLESKFIAGENCYHTSKLSVVVDKINAILNKLKQHPGSSTIDIIEADLLETTEPRKSIIVTIYNLALQSTYLGYNEIFTYTNQRANLATKMKSDLSFNNGSYDPIKFAREQKRTERGLPIRVKSITYGRNST
jgi:hypothetical protein